MASTYTLTTEKSVLSCLMQDTLLFDEIRGIIDEGVFQHPASRTVFTGIERGVSKGKIDRNVVVSELETMGLLNSLSYGDGVRGEDVIDSLLSMDVSVGSFRTYVTQLIQAKGASEITAMLDKVDSMIDAGTPLADIMAYMEAEESRIANYGEIADNPVKDIADVGAEFIENFNRDLETGENSYIYTGYNFWDDWAGGLYKGRLYILGAFSSDGKSTLAQSIIKKIALDGVDKNGGRRKIYYWTAESDSQEIFAKFVRMMTGIPQIRIEQRQITEREKEPFRDAVNELMSGHLMIDDSPFISLPILRTRIRKAVAEGAELVVLDQLDEITVPGHKWTAAQEYLKVNHIAMHIKAIAREEGVEVPIILLHQLGRKYEGKTRDGKSFAPDEVTMDALYQGGEKHANAIAILRHERKKQSVVKSFLNWVKMREGDKRAVLVGFDMLKAVFLDWEGDVPEDDNDVELPDWMEETSG